MMLSSEEDYLMNLDDNSDHGEDLLFDDYDNDDLNDDNEEFEFEDINANHDSSSRPSSQGDVLQRVMDLLMVGVSHARTLLIHYRWNVDKLVTVFVEKGKDHLFAEAGVKVVQCCDLGTQPSSSSIVFCLVCMEDVRCNEATQMDCEHSFCNNCWTEHFIMQIMEGHSRRIRKLVSKKNQDLVKRFDRSLLESYIEENKLVRWCPSVPHCGNAIRVESDVLCEVECKCGLQFCFNCLSEAHSPCSCLMWELWTKKWKDESLSVKWIMVNAKNCPSCKKPVEKNGGCNIVKCVWKCLQAKSYNHECGRYVEPGEEIELSRKSLHRYIHYYDHFIAHRNSLKLETKLEKSVRERISSSEKETGLLDFSWLEKGVRLLFRSRRVLSYSYAFAYYMFGDELFRDDMNKEVRKIKQNLFEDHQQQFEANVEKFSRLIEEPFDKYCEEDIKAVRSKVVSCLHYNQHNIAPYRSDGVERASELSASLSSMGSGAASSENEINGCMRMKDLDESSSFVRSNKLMRIK
ncbi:putative E3 ubiquitin-protein ligase ARI1 [Bienertia sinuspersici]